MRILVRADASHDLGTGHVMRCLTLLDALSTRADSVRAEFVCARTEGHLGDLISSRGHSVHFLDSPADAAQTAQLALGADLVIVDHYDLDATWERAMPCPVMAIDDLADRTHQCDLLLDQNLGRSDSDYDGLVPTTCRKLTGPHFALLRPEFALARPGALSERSKRQGRPLHILIAMGGTDAPNATGWIATHLGQLDLPPGAEVSVVLGATAPHLEAVKTSLKALPVKTTLHVGTNKMADLMAKADLAIGAGGSTSWERCALGLPTLLIVIADNQIDGARALVAAGAARKVTLHDTAALTGTLTGLLTSAEATSGMSSASAALCDGLGAARVADAVLTRVMAPHRNGPRVTLRRATMDDAHDVWEWRHAGEAWRHFKTAAPVALRDHLTWFATALADPDRILLIGECDGVPASHVRIDAAAGGLGSISIYVAPRSHGKGVGTASVRQTLEFLAAATAITNLQAEVAPDNAPSRRMFTTAGFRKCGHAGGFDVFEARVRGRNSR